MRAHRIAFACVCACLWGFTGVARGQDAGDTGITMGFPASVGFLWHATDRLAVRPELSFSKSTSDTDSDVLGTITGDGWSLSTGASVLVFLQRWEELRTYAAPRLTYSRTVSETDSLFDSPVEVTISGFGFAGLFGAHYAPHPRFSIFGEIGLGYTDRTTKSDRTALRTESSSWGTTGGVGVVLYLGSR